MHRIHSSVKEKKLEDIPPFDFIVEEVRKSDSFGDGLTVLISSVAVTEEEWSSCFCRSLPHASHQSLKEQ